MMRRIAGFTYIAVLFAVAIMGIGLATVGQVWRTAEMRERESDLLFVGAQYRAAIMIYYESAPGGAKKYPESLHDLLKDNRFPDTRRYLRKLYRDPITNKPEWGISRAPDGGIMGVYSLSDQKVLKVANFRDSDRDLEGKTRYSEWKFFYSPSPHWRPIETGRIVSLTTAAPAK